MDTVELTGPIVLKDAKRRIAYAPVLVPGEEDSDGEKVTAEKVEQVAHEWMAAYRNIDHDHSLNNLEAFPVESYITPAEMTVKNSDGEVTIPQGSWILATKFTRPEDWTKVEKGEWGGYSIMGVRRMAESAMKSRDEMVAASKRTLLGDLGDDWVTTHVSVVDQPAVPKAKWFALKSRDSGRLFSRKNAFTVSDATPTAEKEGMRFSASTLSKLEEATQAMTALLSEANDERERKGKANKSSEEDEMDIEEVKAAIDGAVKEAVTPLQERLDSFEERVESAAKAAEKNDDTTGDEGGDDDKVNERLGALEEELSSVKAENEKLTTSNEELQEKVTEVVKAAKGIGASKRAKGQDGDPGANTTDSPGRDAFGRRRTRTTSR